MLRNRNFIGPASALLVLAFYGCTRQSPVDLATSLKGIEQSKFLSCSGPPILALSEAGQDRMSFVTNLKAGNAIGIASPTAVPEASCSVGAVFQDGRLVSSTFSGNQSMCSVVFSSCLPK